MREQQPPGAAGAYQHFHTAEPARGKFAWRQAAVERTTGNGAGEERGERGESGVRAAHARAGGAAGSRGRQSGTGKGSLGESRRCVPVLTAGRWRPGR